MPICGRFGLCVLRGLRLLWRGLITSKGANEPRIAPKSPASARFAQARRDLLQTAVFRKEEGVWEGAQGTLANDLSSTLLSPPHQDWHS